MCNIRDYVDTTQDLDFVLPLRLLLALEEDLALKERLARVKVDVEVVRKRNAKIYGESSDAKIIDTITKKLKHPADKAGVERALGLVEKYSMVLDAARGTVGMFEELAAMTPSCVPNTYFSCYSNRDLMVKANRPLEQGEPVTMCKVSVDKCNLFRRRLLQEALVDCSCARYQSRL